MALHHREWKTGLVHHSDQGSQHTDSEYQQLFKGWDIKVSMNGVSTWYDDNAPLEAFFGSLNSEWTYRRVSPTWNAARTDLFYYVEGFYNCRRVHLALDYVSPFAYEQLYH